MADSGPSAQAMIEKRKGNEHFVKNKFAEAIAHYTNALDLVADVKSFESKQRSILFANRAECYIRLGRYREAITECNSALKYDGSNIKARFRRAKANEKTSNFKESLRDLQVVMKGDGGSNRKAIDLMRIVQRKLKGDGRLSYEPETDVSEKDQEAICKYNVLNHTKTNLEDDIAAINSELRGLDDAGDAVEMLLDEDACRLRLGNSFMAISNEDTEEYLAAKSKELKGRERALRGRLSETIDQMTALRAKLKAKFGDHIGLPEIAPSQNVKR